MTLTTTGTVIVRATPQEVLEFVCDLDRYRQVDTKIVRVIERCDLTDSDHGTARSPVVCRKPSVPGGIHKSGDLY